MGWYFKEAFAAIVLVGMDAPTFNRLRPTLTKHGSEDPGTVEIYQAQDFADCRTLIDRHDIRGVCINIPGFSPAETVAFVADLRTTHPLITFCLAGPTKVIRDMDGFHKNWRERFKHYFHLKTDANEADFEANVGALRDLFIADVVKCKALGQYQTTPGALVRLKAASPYGFWLSLIVLTLTALIASAIGPVMERYLSAPDKSPAAQAPPAAKR